MGFIDRIKGMFKSTPDISISKKYEKNVDTSHDTQILSKYRYSETLDMNDIIIERYTAKTKNDIQAEILKKYGIIENENINRILAEEQQVSQEVDEALEGEDKKTREEVKKKVLEEKDEDPTVDKKDKYKEKIYEVMFKDYQYKFLKAKDSQFYNLDIALDKDKAVEMLAYEKTMENLELSYNKNTGKKLSQTKNISKMRDEFDQKLRYDQRGINTQIDSRIDRLNMLYAIREKKYRDYIEALTDDTKTPQEKFLYKKDYEDANLDLIQNCPSLEEYSKDLENQSKIEEEAKKLGIKTTSLYSQKPDRAQDGTKSYVADNLDKTIRKRDKKEDLNLEMADKMLEKEVKEGDMATAAQIANANSTRSEYNESIDGIDDKKSVSKAKEDVAQKEESNRAFIEGLQAYVKPENERDLDNNDLEHEEKAKEEKIKKISDDAINKNDYENEIVRKNKNWNKHN